MSLSLSEPVLFNALDTLKTDGKPFPFYLWSNWGNDA